MSTVINVFKDEALEATAREAIRLDESKALLEKFVTLVRESGTPDEEVAGHYIVDRLKALGVPVTLHTPELYISNPVRAELTLDCGAAAGSAARPSRARPPAMARSTGDAASRSERSATCLRSTQPARRRCSTRQMPLAAGEGADPVAAASCSPRASRCPAPCRRSSGAAPSPRSTSTRARTSTKASARRSGARRRPNRSDASRRRRSSASTIRTAKR